ncbi:BatD family protein [Haliea sp. E1-2-M8]|uniref:BatD family protein n=1 Tax=Haliea sp. E1-2-M8 TaxID=3064706 RepID=UPI00271B0954|nr:BatD family protein [Haliea sp. E1-2-M8]MDO8863057.1 BatD family protein [Haliea sp. E1-2-M8]
MSETGSRAWLGLGLGLLLWLWCAAPQAALEVAVDREQVALGDSLRLVIAATGDEDLDGLDLRNLLADFEILQRSMSSSTSIINGQTTRTRQLSLDLTPRREGTLQIPAFRAGAETTQPVAIEVGPPPTLGAADQEVLFTAEVDRSEVYVQGQLLLTLRIQQAINLDSRSVSELQLDGAFVKPLEQNSFQRTIEGRPWLVHEVRYAIFPEQSGTLEIPAQVFTARESSGRRSVFDLGGGGRQLQRRTEPLTITVRPRPAAFPAGATWLPARNLTLDEDWSTPPDQLQAGESATRTLRLRGEGVQGAQLPPVEFTAPDALRYYPDQPLVDDREDGNGVVGLRRDSAALVGSRAGSWTLPEVRIPWWDTETDSLRYAVLPAREISIAAAPGSPAPLDPAQNPVTSPAPTTATTGADTAAQRLWQALAALFALGWLATLAWHWRSTRGADAAPALAAAPAANPGEARAFKQLQAACASNSAPQARRALLAWGKARLPGRAGMNAAALAANLDDAALVAAVAALDRALYRDGGNSWDGAALLAAVARLRGTAPGRGAHNGSDALTLYPRGT